MPEKVPIMTRFDRRLEKHGLSFGDALNIVLFLLTIASLYLAYQGVRLARVTLEDARVQATQAQKDAAKSAQDEDIQFQKQMAQLKTASDAMRETSGLLRDLQGISRQQLKDMNAAEAREQRQERARPAPAIEAVCDEQELFYAPARVLADPIIGFVKSTTLHPHDAGVLSCELAVRNDGDMELRNATLDVGVYCRTADEARYGKVYIESDGNSNLPPQTSVSLVTHETLPTSAHSDRELHGRFKISSGSCKQVSLWVDLDADNLGRKAFYVEIALP